MRYLVYAAAAWIALMIVFAACGCSQNTKTYVSAVDTGRQPIVVVGIEHRF